MPNITISRDQQLMVCDGKRYSFTPEPPSACHRCSLETPGNDCPLGYGPQLSLVYREKYRRFCDGPARKDGVNGCWKEVT
jgi:hypothetical protein